MRRKDRAKELLEQAQPYDLIILDEAHHARRQGIGSDSRPNQLLQLMQQLKNKTQGLILLTATPMQVDPLEVWDLLNLLGLPPQWTSDNFTRFFEVIQHHNPSHPQFEFLANLFRDVEATYGETPLETALKFLPTGSKLTAKKILSALRDNAQLPRKQLSTEQRKAAIQIIRASTPINKLISRHTRDLLRRYYHLGKITTPIATRLVSDEFVTLSPKEKQLYQDLEDYISTTYNQASSKEKNAVGFIMTIYRRRLASSFAALEKTLTKRIEKIQSLSNPNLQKIPKDKNIFVDEDILDDETDEIMDLEQANSLEQKTLALEECQELQVLLNQVRQLPTDTKTTVLLEKIKQIKQLDYQQLIIFTQYTDTMDFLRQIIVSATPYKILCFSGRGGEVFSTNKSWRSVSREEIKRLFREGNFDILLCTDAAAEGLNFQFCGALINYDMPWNPMRVEQRIGRIDRLGQKYPTISIINLHYRDTIETDVYIALRNRINLFSQYVGKLQPILANLSKNITNALLASNQNKQRQDLINDLEKNITTSEQENFDLDQITQEDIEESLTPTPLYYFTTLDYLLQNSFLLPPGIEVKSLNPGEYKYSMPGMNQSLRVTTDRDYYEQHPGSTELWSPGSPLFPIVENTLPLPPATILLQKIGDMF